MIKYKYNNIDDAIESLMVRCRTIQYLHNWEMINSNNVSLKCCIADRRGILEKIEEECGGQNVK